LDKTISMNKTDESVLLLVKVPYDNKEGPSIFEEMLDSIHNLISGYRISFEMLSLNQHVYLFVWCPKAIYNSVQGQIYAHYPFAEIDIVKDYASTSILNSGMKFIGAEMTYRLSDLYPIKTYKAFETSSVSSIFSLLAKAQSMEQIWIQIVIKDGPGEGSLGFSRSVKLRFTSFLNKFRISRFFRTKSRDIIAKKEREAAIKKAEKDNFLTTIRLVYFAPSESTAYQKLQ